MGEFDGRVAIVTGGAQGIGLATAQVLVQAGASVLAFDRDRENRHSGASLRCSSKIGLTASTAYPASK